MALPDTPPPPVASPVTAYRPAWSSSLRWFLAEFLVVVAGILVALAVSSWAQGRADITREQSYLHQLLADLTTNERDLAEAVDFFDQRASASARVLHRFWQETPRADDAFVDDLSLPRTTRRFRPVLGTAEALISSGDLNLIRSDAVRAAILGYVESTKTPIATTKPITAPPSPSSTAGQTSTSTRASARRTTACCRVPTASNAFPSPERCRTCCATASSTTATTSC
jgi:hypothetical protein